MSFWSWIISSGRDGGHFNHVNADDVPAYAPGGDDAAWRTLLGARMAEYNEANLAMNLVLFKQVSIYTKIAIWTIKTPSVVHSFAGILYKFEMRVEIFSRF